ncbi:peptidoglycan-binding domain-containing protein [Roseivivax sediminis]|uniref:Peptidoglycan binding domain-containing protein n=1 Tax=Roseivivax sediminis TaxID=936889 RepID=A0A1I1ZPS2_9RHOB|nr:peptidoglycan-binding domain-containing protein [Roseivivax sediminis]SFE33666.1 Putative peptidoglycan binding domain-containing protein [Roseivivax sediminis]
MFRHLSAAALAVVLSAAAALAQGHGLIIANGEYKSLPPVSGANRVLATARPLERQGFEVVTQVEANNALMSEAMVKFVHGINATSERAVVILSGHFVHTAADTYLVSIGAPRPLAEGPLMTRALSVSDVLGVLAEFPGRAVLMLAEEPMESLERVHFLSPGSGDIALPDGVSLVRGTPRQIERLASRELAEPRRDFVDAVKDAGLRLEGHAPPRLVFIPEEGSARSDDDRQSAEAEKERRLWQSIRARDDIAGYERYLSAYPDGPNAREARARLNALRDSPQRRAEAREDALGLNRTARQEIQSDLTTLDYDTRGVDGIFGPGTRSAIETWQRDNERAVTGYLTRDDIDRIAAQSRQAQRDQEAREEAQRQERERRDRAYWSDLGQEPSAQDLRTYLDRFPNGIYEEQARSRLRRLEERDEQRATERDRLAFRVAQNRDTVAAYRHYLQEFPNGENVQEARAAIRALRGADGTNGGGQSGAGAQAREQENALGLPQAARALAEQRLRAAGVDPGRVDGTFDAATRRALRNYQQARGLQVSGFLDNATATQLLTETIFGR